jgi:2-iminobutanoate/2-iminopropanoate deaminase
MSANERIQTIYVDEGHRHTSPIPQGVKAGGFIFLSALRGVDITTQKVEEDDPEAQARVLFENMKRALAAAGATLSDVVRVAVYMTTINNRQVFNKVWAEYFGDPAPARFAVQVEDFGAPGDKSKFLCEVTALDPG